MDWVEGTDLARLLGERGRPGLAPSSVLAYLAQAAEALTHLHSQDPPVIHGDVKPANLILTKGGRVKLVDFGLSSAPAAPRRRAGTPGFRAPELAADGVPSRASDVYSLAATAFALLSGSAPSGVLPSWEGIEPAQAEQLEAALRLGLATDPARRPATPGELVESLRSGWGAALPTGVMTFCLSDIEGSTTLWEDDPAAMAEALVRHDEIIAAQVEARGGRVLKSMGEGDSTVSVFESAPRALDAAVAATHALQEEAWPGGLRLAVRFGLHTGEAERRGADYFGPTLNLAARLRGQADGGQIFVSAATAALVAQHLPAGCELVDLGPHRLRGLRAPERIHALKGPGIGAPLPAGESPYRGLLAFEPDDRRFFFGREDVVEEILARLAPGRLLAVIGASGSGKSSVLRAGVVGAVLAGEVAGVERARILTPGAEPRLEVADDPRELVVVDQFEELYTLCEDPARRDAFIDGLLALSSPVVIGVRADLYGKLSDHPELARAVADNQILLGAMGDEELERAITEPARVAGLATRAGPRGADPARRGARARRPAAALARAARDLGTARRTDAHGRGVPRQRRRRVGDRADRRLGRGGGAARSPGAHAQPLPAPDGAGRGDRGHAAPRRGRGAGSRGSLPGGGRGAARPAGGGEARDARRGDGGGRPRGADPRVADAARLAGGGPRRYPPAPPAGRRGPPVGRGGPGGRRSVSRHEARRGGGMGAVAPGRAERDRARVSRRERRGVRARAPHAAPRQPALAGAARRRRPPARRRRDRGSARAARERPVRATPPGPRTRSASAPRPSSTTSWTAACCSHRRGASSTTPSPLAATCCRRWCAARLRSA